MYNAYVHLDFYAHSVYSIIIRRSDMTVRELEKLLLQDGWIAVKQVGSHRQYKHTDKPGKVTVPQYIKVM